MEMVYKKKYLYAILHLTPSQILNKKQNTLFLYNNKTHFNKIHCAFQ